MYRTPFGMILGYGYLTAQQLASDEFHTRVQAEAEQAWRLKKSIHASAPAATAGFMARLLARIPAFRRRTGVELLRPATEAAQT